MAIDLKYGQIEIGNLPEDEPVFIIRARDSFSLPTIARYFNFAEGSEQTSPEFIAGLRDVLDRFRDWQQEHLQRVPD